MQRKIGTEIVLGKTVCPFYSIGALSAIDRTASKYLSVSEKVRKIGKLIETGTYDGYQWRQQSNRNWQPWEKNIYFEFQNWSILKMKTKLRPTKSVQQIKDEVIVLYATRNWKRYWTQFLIIFEKDKQLYDLEIF